MLRYKNFYHSRLTHNTLFRRPVNDFNLNDTQRRCFGVNIPNSTSQSSLTSLHVKFKELFGYIRRNENISNQTQHLAEYVRHAGEHVKNYSKDCLEVGSMSMRLMQSLPKTVSHSYKEFISEALMSSMASHGLEKLTDIHDILQMIVILSFFQSDSLTINRLTEELTSNLEAVHIQAIISSLLYLEKESDLTQLLCDELSRRIGESHTCLREDDVIPLLQALNRSHSKISTSFAYNLNTNLPILASSMSLSLLNQLQFQLIKLSPTIRSLDELFFTQIHQKIQSISPAQLSSILYTLVHMLQKCKDLRSAITNQLVQNKAEPASFDKTSQPSVQIYLYQLTHSLAHIGRLISIQQLDNLKISSYNTLEYDQWASFIEPICLLTSLNPNVFLEYLKALSSFLPQLTLSHIFSLSEFLFAHSTSPTPTLHLQSRPPFALEDLINVPPPQFGLIFDFLFDELRHRIYKTPEDPQLIPLINSFIFNMSKHKILKHVVFPESISLLGSIDEFLYKSQFWNQLTPTQQALLFSNLAKIETSNSESYFVHSLGLGISSLSKNIEKLSINSLCITLSSSLLLTKNQINTEEEILEPFIHTICSTCQKMQFPLSNDQLRVLLGCSLKILEAGMNDFQSFIPFLEYCSLSFRSKINQDPEDSSEILSSLQLFNEISLLDETSANLLRRLGLVNIQGNQNNIKPKKTIKQAFSSTTMSSQTPDTKDTLDAPPQSLLFSMATNTYQMINKISSTLTHFRKKQ